MEKIDINIEQIDFDIENPRIQNALEKYSGGIDYKKIHFALKSIDEGSGGSGFNKLRSSIKASGRIHTPIQVVKKDDGRYTCIDGNTRLLIYKEFRDDNFQGNWDIIPAIIIDDDDDIDKVRITAHVVGAREWLPFNKAKYLYKLYKEKNLSFSELVLHDICGGNQNEIEELIDAYEDMVRHYKERTTEDKFYTNRFSGFVELQGKKIKPAILNAGYTLDDFGDWIMDGRIDKLADVRQLPEVLSDPEAKAIFLEDGIGSAINSITARKHIKGGKKKIDDLDLSDLIALLSDKMEKIRRVELEQMRRNIENTNGSDILLSLRNLQLDIIGLINDLDRGD